MILQSWHEAGSFAGPLLGVAARTKQTALFAVIGIGLLALILGLARRGALTMRFVLGWMAVSATLIGVGPISAALDTPARRLGITPTGLLLGVSTSVVLAIALQLSISVSGLRATAQDLGEALALRPAVPRHERLSDVVVVIPALNEAASIEPVIRQVRALHYDCVVIDDGSTDATAALAMDAGATVVSHPQNLGVGAALRTGFRFALAHGYRVVVQCDGDGQHHPAEISTLLQAIQHERADLVIGSRFAPGGSYGGEVSKARSLGISLLRRSASRAARAAILDPTSGFRAISGSLLVAFAKSYPTHYLADTHGALLSAARAGYVVREVPVSMSPRQGGVASASPWQSGVFLARAFLLVRLRITPRIKAPIAGSPAAWTSRD